MNFLIAKSENTSDEKLFISAMKQYNGVPLDVRPMQIQIATSELNGSSATSPLRRVGGGGGGRVEKPKRGASGGGARYGLRN